MSSAHLSTFLGYHDFHILSKPTIHQVLTLDDRHGIDKSDLASISDLNLGSEAFSDIGSEINYHGEIEVNSDGWEEMELALEYEDLSAWDETDEVRPLGRLLRSQSRLSYAEALFR